VDARGELARLVALAGGQLGALVRQICAAALSLPPLPADTVVIDADTDGAVASFAEQFSVDVAGITDQQRSALFSALGDQAFGAVVHMYIADFVPRVRAGLEALGVGREYLDWVCEPIPWEQHSDPSAAVFNGFLPAVARMRALDPLTSEVVRLRGATQHNCRLCKSLRETTALDVGGSEMLYSEIEHFENSRRIADHHKAALRYTDALIWSPARIDAAVATAVCEHFSEAAAIELTFDVMRNASNKIAVSLGADAPRVEHGTQRYLIDANGQTVFS
jgi:alkylhydroperoxidase family enzyme